LHEKRKQDYTTKLKEIIQNVESSVQAPNRWTRHLRGNSVSFTLVDQWIDEYDAILEALLIKEGWSQKYSESYVEKLIKELIGEVLSKDDINLVQSLFENLSNNFENYSREQKVYIPLHWIQMELDQFQLGNITLVQMNQTRIDELATTINQVVDSVPNSQEEKQALIEGTRGLLQRIADKVCSEFIVIAEPDRARQRAEEETRRVIDLLRYSIPALYPRSILVSVGLVGESLVSVPRFSPVKTIGPLTPFQINEANLEVMERIGVLAASKILQKNPSHLNDFEDAILRGIHWLANSMVQGEKENAFLSLITCIENYLTPRDGNPIGTAIAEGVAIILGNDLESRKRLKSRIKALYRNRSGISHGGKTTILEVELVELTNLAGSLTIWMIERQSQFQSISAVLGWIENRKFA
jgi:hypothetical protein